MTPNHQVDNLVVERKSLGRQRFAVPACRQQGEEQRFPGQERELRYTGELIKERAHERTVQHDCIVACWLLLRLRGKIVRVRGRQVLRRHGALLRVI